MLSFPIFELVITETRKSVPIQILLGGGKFTKVATFREMVGSPKRMLMTHRYLPEKWIGQMVTQPDISHRGSCTTNLPPSVLNCCESEPSRSLGQLKSE